MKKINIFYFLVASVLFAGCKKDNGPVPGNVALERVPAPLIVKDPTGSAAIDMGNLAGFNGKFNVSLYFPNDIPPSKMDIVVRKNSNNTMVKVLQAGVTTFPMSGTLTAAQIATLFGVPVALGDTYDVGADVYSQSGKKYEAFPTLGLGYAAAFQPDHPGFSPSVTFATICPFTQSVFTGKFTVITDTWGDFDQPPQTVDVVPGPAANQVTIFAYPAPKYGTNRKGMVINITPANVVTIPEQIIGDYFAGGGTFDKDITIQGGGTVNSCTKTISLTGLRFKQGMGGPAYGGGPYSLTLKQ